MVAWKLPPEKDFKFYQRRKHDKWREVSAPTPALETAVADTHAHVHSLPDALWELERCRANGVNLVCDVADPTDDAIERVFEIAEADTAIPVVLSIGVHPHNADKYSDELEQKLREYLTHPSVVALGEVGLDYYYDNSERDAQRDVFQRQIRLAKELSLPLALHLRSGDGPEADAHREAFEILSDEGFPTAGTLVHCCSLDPDRIKPWIDADCYIAYGGALTFKGADEAQAGACLVPENRLLLETDSPYMTPEPMRGTTCTPAHVIYTAERLASVRNQEPGKQREQFLSQIRKNTDDFFGLAD